MWPLVVVAVGIGPWQAWTGVAGGGGGAVGAVVVAVSLSDPAALFPVRAGLGVAGGGVAGPAPGPGATGCPAKPHTKPTWAAPPGRMSNVIATRAPIRLRPGLAGSSAAVMTPLTTAI